MLIMTRQVVLTVQSALIYVFTIVLKRGVVYPLPVLLSIYLEKVKYYQDHEMYNPSISWVGLGFSEI